MEFKTQNVYLLNVYSSDLSQIEHVSLFIREAYKEICTAGLSADISADCDFHSNHVQAVVPSSAVNDDKEWDCFLSHSWGKNKLTHQRVVLVAQELETHGLRVWVDEEQLSDTVEQGVVQGMAESHVFVAFVTREYLEASNKANNNAGQEFRCAAKRDVNMIIPVVLDEELLSLHTWNKTVLMLKLATKLYIDFSSPAKQRANMEELVKRIKLIKAKSLRKNN